MKRKFFDRVSARSLLDGELDPNGRIFLTPDRPRDLSCIRILHAGVDTLRQLYEGRIHPRIHSIIHERYHAGPKSVMQLAGEDWLVGSGGGSGYRYRLQNNTLGLILFVGSRYQKLDGPGAHLKIEASPHFLQDQSPATVERRLDAFAKEILKDPTHTGVAVHLAVDVQGWRPPRDFSERLAMKARRQQEHTGLDRLELIGGETVQRYDGGQSYLFGGPQSVQFAVYCKDREALARDKLDYWESVWKQATHERGKPMYREGKPVWRLEWRFHHTIVRQVQSESGKGFRTYSDVAPVLTNFLRYGLELYSLNFNEKSPDPFWQLLYQDVEILGRRDDFTIRRVHRTPARGNEKNLTLAFGNMISLYARYGYKTHQVIHCLKHSGLWEELCHYWRNRRKDPQAVIAKSLQLRALAG